MHVFYSILILLKYDLKQLTIKQATTFHIRQPNIVQSN